MSAMKWPMQRQILKRKDDAARFLGNESTDSMETLKNRLLTDRLGSVSDSELRETIQLAAHESVALAWSTPFPLLVLPELIEENGRAAQRRLEMQRRIRDRSKRMISFSA